MKIFQDGNIRYEHVAVKFCGVRENTMNFAVCEQYCIVSFCSSVEPGVSFIYLKKHDTTQFCITLHLIDSMLCTVLLDYIYSLHKKNIGCRFPIHYRMGVSSPYTTECLTSLFLKRRGQ